MARGCARVDYRLATAKTCSNGRVDATATGCVQFFGEEKRFGTAWVIPRCYRTAKLPAGSTRSTDIRATMTSGRLGSDNACSRNQNYGRVSISLAPTLQYSRSSHLRCSNSVNSATRSVAVQVVQDYLKNIYSSDELERQGFLYVGIGRAAPGRAPRL